MATGRIERWVERELDAWQGKSWSPATFEALMTRTSEGHPGVCLFRLADGKVEIDPATLARHRHFGDPSSPLHVRAAAYLALLRTAVNVFAVRGSGTVAIHLNDLHIDLGDAPVFFFQKPSGARGILLPDIDFLMQRFYVDDDDRLYDHIPFAAKQPKAIFVGSTTGDIQLTAAKVQTLQNARLRSAVAFRDEPDVVFDLPNIVQYDNPATRALIEQLGIGGQRRGWQEQLGYRYLLSMDGNGATCSRVVLALLSNSVLAKYQSANQLYYFQGLKPGRHYISVATDDDVIGLVRNAEASAAEHQQIAERSRRFAEMWLSRIAVLRYTATLLSEYLGMFGSGGGAIGGPDTELLIDSAAHFGQIGTIWTLPGAWAGGVARAIEGFVLVPGTAIPADALEYAAVSKDGTATEWCAGRRFCGSKGKAKPLHGLAARLSGDAASRFVLTGQARFADGTSIVVTDEIPLPSPAPLTAFRFTLTPR